MKTVLILGSSPFPEFEETLRIHNPEIWCLNKTKPPREYHRWFQLHSFKHMVKAHGEEYLDKLFKCPVPLVLFPREAEKWASLREVIPYPVDAALKLASRPYFDGSFAWMIAMAILEGYDRIILGGLSLGEDVKKLWQNRLLAAEWLEDHDPKRDVRQVVNNLRGVFSGDESWAIPCITYFLGLAQGRGIETLVIGDQHGLFFNKWGDGALYGYDPRAGGE